VHVPLPLSPWEAALGATVPVDTPGGQAQVVVPEGSSTGRRLRLRGRGLPNPRGAAGDLYAEVRVMVPTELSRKERKLFSQLADVSHFDPRDQEDRRAEASA
jgi:curved DNA-binding protein